MRKPNQQIDGASLEQMRSLCVYAWRRGDVYLYVGLSVLGLGRPLGCHNVIAQTEPIQPCDTLDVWHFSRYPTAAAFEQQQIRNKRPIYNSMIGVDQKESLHDATGIGPPCKFIICRSCKTRFMQGRWYQVECALCARGEKAVKKANRLRRLRAERKNATPDPIKVSR